jgi:hypothetical protein
VTFRHVTRTGRYAIGGKYLGDAALDGSRGAGRFRVGA